MEILKMNYKKILITFVITIITALLLIFTTQNTYAQSNTINNSVTGDIEILGEPETTPGRIKIQFEDFRSDGLSFLTLKIGRSFNYNTHLGKSVRFNIGDYKLVNQFYYLTDMYDVSTITFTVMTDSIAISFGDVVIENVKSIHENTNRIIYLIEEDVNLVMWHDSSDFKSENNPKTITRLRDGEILGNVNYTAFNNKVGHRHALYSDLDLTQEVTTELVINGFNEIIHIYHAYEWIEGETVTINFVDDTGDILEPIVVTLEAGDVLEGKTVSDLGITLPIPTRDMHEFKRWVYNGVYTFDEDFVFERYKMDKNTNVIEVKANWIKLYDEYTVYFDPNGATDDYWKDYTGWDREHIVNSGDLIIMPEEIPYKKNSRFIGWSKQKYDFVEYDFDTPVTSQIRLYAFFESLNYANVTYETNGGSIPINNGQLSFNVKVRYEIPTKFNNGFNGWFMDELLTIPAPNVLLREDPTHHDFTLYAKWQEHILADENNMPLTTAHNKLATVTFDVNGKLLNSIISYEGYFYSLQHHFSNETDMSIFSTEEAYYQNINDNPQIIINHSDRLYLRDILESPDNEKPAFVPHTIWDLTTNELVTRNKYDTNVYMKQNDKGLMIAYVYIDEFIMDHIVQATLSWTSRQKNGFPASIINGKYTDWETIIRTMTSDEEFEYRNLTFDIQDIIPIWNIISGIRKSNVKYSIPRIDSVDFNNIQKEYNIEKLEVESYFNEVNDNFEHFNNNPRYKLWAFTLQEGKDWLGTQTELYHNPNNKDDEKNFKILELIYITNGKLYETLGDDMDLHIKIDGKIDGVANEKDSIISLIVYGGIFLLYVFALFKFNAFTSFSRALTITLIFGFILFIGLVGYNHFFGKTILFKVLASIRLLL